VLAQGGPDCASALAVPLVLPFNMDSLTTCGSIDDYDSGNSDICGSALYMSGEDHLYAFTPIANGAVYIDVNSSSTFMGLYVFSDCPDSGTGCVASAFSAGGSQSLMMVADSGVTYFVMIDSWPAPPCHPLFELSISAPGVLPTPTINDCLGAQLLCAPVHTELDTVFGEGNYVEEINDATSCLGGGEVDGYWYIVTAQGTGDLCFNIVPTDLTDDFDWAVFDLTQHDCSDIFSDASMEVSCNFSGLPDTTGANGLPGGQNEPCLNVVTGQVLALYVSNWSQSESGFNIHFDLPNSQVSIVDTVPPSLVSNPPVVCETDTLLLTFNGAVLCSSVQPSDIEIDGPGGPYTVTALIDADCDQGGAGSTFTVFTNPPLQPVGSYTIALVDTVIDVCGNVAIADSMIMTFGTTPYVDFTWLPDPVELPDTLVWFTNLSVGAVACEWWVDSVLASTDCSPAIPVPGVVGMYGITLSILDASGCSASLTDSLLVVDTTSIGIDEIGTNDLGSLYDILAQVAVSGRLADLRLSVWDDQGRCIVQHMDAAQLDASTPEPLRMIIAVPGLYTWRLADRHSGTGWSGRSVVTH
jgi:hypothetical protein